MSKDIVPVVTFIHNVPGITILATNDSKDIVPVVTFIHKDAEK